MIIPEMANNITLVSTSSLLPQKNPLTIEQLCLPSSVEEYTDLLMWTMENCTNMKLSLITKYHARAFFDLVLAAQNGIPLERYIPALMASLALSIKFHQARATSELITPQILMNGVGLSMTNEEFSQFQIYVLKNINYQMRLVTPEDYLNDFLAVFPIKKSKKMIFKASLPKIIDLALIHARTCEFTAKDIFFGSILAAIKVVPVNLSENEIGLLMDANGNWEKAELVCQIIEQQMQITDDESNLQ